MQALRMKGFTLIELLISLVVTAICSMVFGAFLVGSFAMLHSGSARSELYGEYHYVKGTIKREIRSATGLIMEPGGDKLTYTPAGGPPPREISLDGTDLKIKHSLGDDVLATHVQEFKVFQPKSDENRYSFKIVLRKVVQDKEVIFDNSREDDNGFSVTVRGDTSF